MDIPLPGMIDHPDPGPNEPPDDGVHGRSDALPPERRIADHVEQIVGKTSDEKPCLIGCKPMATRLVPCEDVLSFFYPVLDLSPTIADRDYLFCFKIRVGHNKSDTWEEFANMPYLFTVRTRSSVYYNSSKSQEVYRGYL